MVFPVQAMETVDATVPPFNASIETSLLFLRILNVAERLDVELVVYPMFWVRKLFQGAAISSNPEVPQLISVDGYWFNRSPIPLSLNETVRPPEGGVGTGSAGGGVGEAVGVGVGGRVGGEVGQLVVQGVGVGPAGQVLFGWPKQKLAAADGGRILPFASFGLMAILSQCILAGPTILYENCPK